MGEKGTASIRLLENLLDREDDLLTRVIYAEHILKHVDRHGPSELALVAEAIAFADYGSALDMANEYIEHHSIDEKVMILKLFSLDNLYIETGKAEYAAEGTELLFDFSQMTGYDIVKILKINKCCPALTNLSESELKDNMDQVPDSYGLLYRYGIKLIEKIESGSRNDDDLKNLLSTVKKMRQHYPESLLCKNLTEDAYLSFDNQYRRIFSKALSYSKQGNITYLNSLRKK